MTSTTTRFLVGCHTRQLLETWAHVSITPFPYGKHLPASQAGAIFALCFFSLRTPSHDKGNK